jgi:hypothetical protein
LGAPAHGRTCGCCPASIMARLRVCPTGTRDGSIDWGCFSASVRGAFCVCGVATGCALRGIVRGVARARVCVCWARLLHDALSWSESRGRGRKTHVAPAELRHFRPREPRRRAAGQHMIELRLCHPLGAQLGGGDGGWKLGGSRSRWQRVGARSPPPPPLARSLAPLARSLVRPPPVALPRSRHATKRRARRPPTDVTSPPSLLSLGCTRRDPCSSLGPLPSRALARPSQNNLASPAAPPALPPRSKAADSRSLPRGPPQKNAARARRRRVRARGRAGRRRVQGPAGGAPDGDEVRGGHSRESQRERERAGARLGLTPPRPPPPAPPGRPLSPRKKKKHQKKTTE